MVQAVCALGASQRLPRLPALTRAEDSIGSWKKALAVGSQASAVPEQLHLRSREAQVDAGGGLDHTSRSSSLLSPSTAFIFA